MRAQLATFLALADDPDLGMTMEDHWEYVAEYGWIMEECSANTFIQYGTVTRYEAACIFGKVLQTFAQRELERNRAKG